MGHLLQAFQNNLPVAFEHLEPGLILHPAVRNHSHQVEADVVVRLTAERGEGDMGHKALSTYSYLTISIETRWYKSHVGYKAHYTE